MTSAAQRAEVDANYDAFEALLPDILREHRDQYALMRDRRIVAYFDAPGDALRDGNRRFADGVFSIQEVTDEPIDLGFFSHVAFHGKD